jgi:hypothetical protein
MFSFIGLFRLKIIIALTYGFKTCESDRIPLRKTTKIVTARDFCFVKK